MVHLRLIEASIEQGTHSQPLEYLRQMIHTRFSIGDILAFNTFLPHAGPPLSLEDEDRYVMLGTWPSLHILALNGSNLLEKL